MDIPGKIVSGVSETRRILRLTRKPKRTEYGDVSRVTGLGIVAIGIIGFVIFFIAKMLNMV